jgi:hypothetical protein
VDGCRIRAAGFNVQASSKRSKGPVYFITTNFGLLIGVDASEIVITSEARNLLLFASIAQKSPTRRNGLGISASDYRRSGQMDKLV